MKIISQQTEVFKQTIATQAGTDANYVQQIVTMAKMSINAALETIRLENIEMVVGFDVGVNGGVASAGYGTIEFLVGDNDLLVTNDFTSVHANNYLNKIVPNSAALASLVFDKVEMQKSESLIVKPQVNAIPTFRTQYKRSTTVAAFVILQVTYSKIKLTSEEYIALFAV